MSPPAIHLIEAGIVTEQQSAGLAEAPAALAGAFAERFEPEKRIRIPFNPRDRWLAAARESCRTLGDAVAASLAAKATPLVLGGECTLAVGAVCGAVTADAEMHLVYVAAHADFHTLATTRTHAVRGMCLAHLCGRSVAALLWPGARRIDDDRVILVGARTMDAGEAGNIARTRVVRVRFDAQHSDAPGLLAAARRKSVWLHVDVDVIDPADCPAVVSPETGGPSLKAVCDTLRALAGVATIRGIALCGYDPRKDPEQLLPGVFASLVAGVVAKAL